MSNDTNKNEPLDLLVELQETFDPKLQLFHRQWTVEEAIWVLKEIERLREEVEHKDLNNAELGQILTEGQNIPRCGSCDNWNRNLGGFCKVTEMVWDEYMFCSEHPDWKEPGNASNNDANATGLREEEG